MVDSDDSDDYDYAEPTPDTIGAASRTAKCLHCDERIYEDNSDEWGWVHAATGSARCSTLS